PKRERRQLVAVQARLTGALDDVIGRGKQSAATESENDRIGMQWSQTAVAEPRNIEIQLWPYELRGNPYADRHADHTPDYGHDRELTNDTIVEDFGLFSDRIGSAHEFPLKQINNA